MIGLFARLSRIVPLLVLLAVVAGVVYVVMSFRYSSDRAKLALIKLFTWLMAGLSVLFLVVTLYALLEGNVAVTELFASFLGTTLVGLVVTRVCFRVFKKNRPNFGEEVAQATIINESITSRFASAFRKAFGEAMKETFTRGNRRQ